MRKKIFLNFCLIASVAGLISCSNTGWFENDEVVVVSDNNMYAGQVMSEEEKEMYVHNPKEAARIFNKRVPPLDTVIVCRAKQCAPAEMSMSREYIYNSLAHLVDNNLDATALLCEANPQAHVCTNPYLTVPAKIGVTPAYVFFDGVKFVDASAVKGQTALNLVLGYNLSYNGQTPTVCKPDKAKLYVKSNNDIVLNGEGFKCEMTSMGTTTVRVMFDVDYIDLDYGYIGGYYSIGLSGPANGGGSGYGLIRLTKDAHPLNPELMMDKDKPEEKAESKPTYKPEVKAEALKAAEEVAEEKAEEATESEEVEKPAKKAAPKKETSANRRFEQGSERRYVNPAQPMRITPDTVVTSDRVILQPEAQELRPFEVEAVEEGQPLFEEIEADDLDEYIK